jgi:hypothetical protein
MSNPKPSQNYGTGKFADLWICGSPTDKMQIRTADSSYLLSDPQIYIYNKSNYDKYAEFQATI